MIMFAAWRHAEKKQAGPATNLPDALGAQSTNALSCGFHPDTHFFRGDRLAGIAAVPAGDIKSGLGDVVATQIRLVEGLRPLGNLLGTQNLVGFGFVAASVTSIRHYICDELLIARNI